MARKPPKVRSAELASTLRAALDRGAFAPSEASRVLRSLIGDSQNDFAARLGMNVKVIKALESDSGNPHYDSLAKMAAAFGLRVAFVKSGTAVELLNPDARATQERHRRQSDAQALASGRVSAHELHERNALRVDDVHYELPNLV